MLASCSRQKAEGPDQLTIAVPYEFDSLDPHLRNTVSSFTLLSHFYEPLVTTDAGMKLQPCLAQLWENPDHFTWLFHLRSGVRFHDGKTLSAEDVVYSFQRLLSQPDLDISGYLTDVSEVIAEGPLLVRIKTSRPINVLLNKLRFVPIVPKDSTADSLALKDNGTGPYRLGEWRRTETLRMIRNDQYWGKKPASREVVFLLGYTPERALEALKAGKCQIAQCNSRAIESVPNEKPGYTISKNDSLFLKFISFDLSREVTPFCATIPNPFKNKLVRQAIHLAVDRRDIVSRIPTFAVPATQPLPPFVFGYNPRIPETLSDREKAKQLMKQAGYAGGFDVTLHFRNNVVEAASVVAEQLGEIGIRIETKTGPTPQLLASLRGHEYSFFFAGMGCPTGDASEVLDNALHSKDPGRRFGSLNYGRYENAEMDAAIEESAQIVDIDRRRDSLQNIMSMAMEDLPWIPIYIDQDAYALPKAYQWRPRNDSFIFAWEINP